MKHELDLPDLLAALEAELARCELRFGNQLWQAVRGGTPPDPAGHENECGRLLGDDSDLVRIEAVYRRDGDPVLKRRAALWLSLAAWHRTLRRANYSSLYSQLTTSISTHRGRAGGQLLDLEGLRRSLLVDADRRHREEAHTSLVALASEVLGPGSDLRTNLAVAWQGEAGGSAESSFWQHSLACFELEWPGLNLPELARTFLEQTDELLERFSHLAREVAHTSQLREWDVAFALNELAARYDRFFAGADQVPALAKSLRASGLPTDSLPLSVATEPPWLPPSLAGWPGRDWLAVGMGASSRRLGDQWFDERGGLSIGIAVRGPERPQRFGHDLARATGAAIGKWYGRGGHLARRRAAGGLDPAGALLAALVVEPGHLTRHTELPAGDVGAYLAQGCPQSGLLRAVGLRLLAAQAAVAWTLFDDPGKDTVSVAEHWLSRAAGVQVDGRLVALDLATGADPAHWPLLFVTEIAAGQLAGHLLAEHGKLVGDRRTAECLVECFWRHGMLVSAQRALELATGSVLSLDAEVNALLSHVGV